jgi:endonuclease III
MVARGSKALFKRSGAIWKKSPAIRSRIVARVCRTLKVLYGIPRLGNPIDPIDDLVYIVLSNKTSPKSAKRAFRRLKDAYRTWDRVLLARPSKLRALLTPAGLSRVKSQQLWRAFRRIKKDFGTCDLRILKGKPEEGVQEYLTTLPGVSEKVAKCVMMYTMGAQVLPVDAHVHRIARRLGWTARKRADQCHEELESLVPAELRYSFHVDCVLQGREVCRPENPACTRCSISRYCEYFRKANGKT